MPELAALHRENDKNHQSASSSEDAQGTVGFAAVCWVLIFAIVMLRLCTLGLHPLLDTTEARYAGIAQSMLVTGDWITPRLALTHEAFLAKPPLTFWFTAVSFSIFGQTEFAARLPNFLEGLMTLVFAHLIAKKLYDKLTAVFTSLILASSIFFFIEMGTVGLDMMVCLTITMAMYGLLCWQQTKGFTMRVLWCAFLGAVLGLGLLTKGPVTLLIFGGGISIYILWRGNWPLLWQPGWLVVLAVGLSVAAPWYFAVQAANSDFFEYFFINENFKRYLVKDCGDRYGNPHIEPYGMSWVYMLVSLTPWSVALLPYLKTLQDKLKRKELGWKLSDRLVLLLGWCIFTPTFFSFARSILLTYTLSSLPALAILCARALTKSLNAQRKANSSDVLRLSALDFLLSPTGNMGCIVLAAMIVIGGTLAYSGGEPYSIPRSFIMGGTIALVVLVFLLGLLSGRVSARSFQMSLAISALSAPCILSLWYGSLSNSYNGYKSIKYALEDLRRLDENFHNKNIVFWVKEPPFSWSFYLQRHLLNSKTSLREGSQDHSHLCISNPGRLCPKEAQMGTLIIVFREELKSFELSHDNFDGLDEIVNRGRYIVYRVLDR